MKTGLVMEGGAMRGMFTCGVTDVMMEHGIDFDGMIGVSAGAAFGCNYKSKQIGRAIRYNKRFCQNKEFCSFRSWFLTGDLYGADFCYNQLPYELDVWDIETYDNNPMEFYIVCTDVKTGKPYYYKSVGGDADMDYIRASASMPIVSTPVDVGDRKLLDGGISDSIPLEFMESQGYDRNVVILTQPEGFVKEPTKMLGLFKMFMGKYPNIVKDMAYRHKKYNRQLRYVEKREAEGNAFVIRPPEALNIGSMEKDPEELERVYQIGRQTGEDILEKVMAFLGIEKEEKLS